MGESINRNSVRAVLSAGANFRNVALAGWPALFDSMASGWRPVPVESHLRFSDKKADLPHA